MNPLDALHLQLRLEGKVVVHDNLLRQVEVVPDEEMPLVVVALLSMRRLVVYYDEAVSTELRNELGKQISSLNFPDVSALADILKSQGIDLEVGHFKTYIFPESYKDLIFDEVVPLHKTNPKVEAFGFGGLAEQGHAVELNGKIVSACVSARENGSCGEAWVFTDPEYRHQGLAQKVVGAWAKSLLKTGKVPFYSHKIENTASAKLAQCLELEPVFEEITISRMNV